MGWQPRPRFDPIRKRYTCQIRGEHKYLGRTYPAAVKRLAELLGVADADLPPERQPIAVSELVEIAKGRGATRWQQDCAKPWAEHCGMQAIEEMTTDALDEYAGWLAGRGLMPQSIHHHVNRALALLGIAAKEGWIDAVPRKPKLTPAKRRPRDQKRQDIADALAKVHAAAPLVRFVLAVGCRPGEACYLRWDCIDFDRGTAELREHKTAKRTGEVRVVMLTPEAVAVLAGQKRLVPWVFPNRSGEPYTPAGVRSMLYKAGIRGGTYSLRHTAAQGWLDQGVAMEDVAGLLGHKDLRTVTVYAQVRADRLRRVAASIQAVPLPPAREPGQQPSTVEEPNASPARPAKRQSPRTKSGKASRVRSARPPKPAS